MSIHSTVVIKLIKYWHKKRHIDQLNKKNLEINPYIYCQLIFNKWSRFLRGKDSFFNKWCCSLQPCPSHFAFLVRPSTVLAGSSLAVYKHLLPFIFFSPVAQREVKDLPTMQERQEMGIWPLSWEDLLEEEMATHSSISCLNNPMDGGAWRTRVQRVTKSWTWLSGRDDGPLSRPAFSNPLPTLW